ncbi:DUF2092 domain-containing protein [Brevundimonas goettingensis]|uniref:DUF2092 domain-containing protein n=1 Tax=Brevundimonas goettingensis TaxID=2774190 RepID=A0A975C288_9CAUL|nr:DUF2092 domain-containing protein [Brevundimonas goettingensis]QTC90232.1 DUF2092 domain-containing protein [Brevundimonas goettingensis]
MHKSALAAMSTRAAPALTGLVVAAAMTVLPAVVVAMMTEPAVAQETAYTAPAPAEALHRMGAYLGTLQSFEVTSTSSIDLVTEDDRRIDLDGTTTYKVRRPDGFVIETRTDRKHRRFIYDGKRFTVYAPARGFYASVEAPGTIAEVLDVAWDKYGIVVPLEDIFHWGDPANLPTDYTTAEYVGPVTVNGVATDQYAFAGPDIEWQVWIQRGDKPLPLKIVIVDRTDPARPEFSATLAWNTSPRFMDSTFAFAPAGGDKPIPIADQSGAQ